MIHKEGNMIVIGTFLVLVFMNATTFLLLDHLFIICSFAGLSILIILFLLRFFRNPERTAPADPTQIYAPADGKVVVVEETEEIEYFKDRRIQVSVFMSVWNVHINWFPAAGKVNYYRYHPGKYLIARHPKSSSLNERNTVVLGLPDGREILLRQIAGIVARRIISYACKDNEVRMGDELGFIRFGSRVDVFFPPGTEILVRPGDIVKGLVTPLAKVSSATPGT